MATFVVAASLSSVHVAAQPTEAEAAVDPVSQAVLEAAERDEPVEVTQQRTETDTVFANPDGTLARSISTVPIRFRDGTTWRDLDYELARRPDGRIAPRSAPGDVSFSGGGDGAMSTVTTSGVTMATDWIDELPEPTLDGATATYGEVLPGVDLRLTSTPAGTTQVLVVKTPQAAENPTLDAIDLPIDVVDGSLEKNAGGYQVRDLTGRTVASATQPLMWDSSGQAIVNGQMHEPTSDTAVELRSSGPVSGDGITSIPMDVADDSLTLQPVSEALTGHAVEYPVYIDPAHTFNRATWSMVFKEYPSTEFYRWTTSNGEGVGYQNYNGRSTKRLLFRFDISSLARRQILKAEFKAKVVYGASCDVTKVDLWRTKAFNSSTNWSNQPGRVGDGPLSTASVDPCPEGKQIEWSATSGVRGVANASTPGSYLYLKLQAESETNPRAWKRFSNGAQLYVVYNRFPNKPTSVTINDVACTGSRDVLLGSVVSRVIFRATVSDPDSDSVRGVFYMKPGRTESSSNLSSGYDYVVSPSRATKGGVVSADAFAKLRALLNTPEDKPLASKAVTMRVKAQEVEGEKEFSRTFDQCFVEFDPIRPAAPVITVPENPRWGESFGVDVKSIDKDVSRVRWALNSTAASTATQVNLTADTRSTTVTVNGWSSSTNRPRVGTNELRVWAVDNAGNLSTRPALVEFQIEDPSGTTQSLWPFDEDFGSSAVRDTGAAGRGLSLSVSRISDDDGIDWTSGQWVRRGTRDAVNDPHDDLLVFAPGDSPVSGQSNVFEPTNQAAAGSFTVAAYLDPSREMEGSQTAISYGSAGGNDRFRLGIVGERVDAADPDSDIAYYYTFSVWDRRTSTYEIVRSEDPVVLEESLDLVIGSWNPTSNKLVLEVSDEASAEPGVRAESDVAGVDGDAFSPTWSTSDRLRVGGDSAGGSWAGYVDHVSLQAGLPLDGTGDILRRQKSGWRFAPGQCHKFCTEANYGGAS
ncbi:DNRLRE domain-containing protein [Aeromicrobium erythreum]|uniref:DNRLRE domain-containing protein n=1 Tax=Aeromicrobium erythreum TaxID=2041 RepID=A0A0U4AV93_9ACTN|nr:DNRLRE domain-containing protein [Aeromicrobium erythreum]ALX04304.1 hypothetical protein AERYTH_06145 [Aeromicrobium erythreum]